MVKTKKWIVITFIGIIILVFFIFINAQQRIEYKDKLIVLISFVGLFSTFGGAYVGAKISGDNSRKLYEIQKNENVKKTVNKIELIANIKLIKVLNHSKKAKESELLLYVSPKDKRSYDEVMRSGIMEIIDLIDGYAYPIIELLEDREIYDGSPKLYESLLKMFNECNRMNYHVNLINVKDKTGFLQEDYNILNENEREYLIELINQYREYVRKDILVHFVEFLFIETQLNDCFSDILNSISEKNKLVDCIDFKNNIGMRYTID